MDLPTVLVDHLLKQRKQKQKFKETWDSRYIYQNKPDKACFHFLFILSKSIKLNGNAFYEFLALSICTCVCL